MRNAVLLLAGLGAVALLPTAASAATVVGSDLSRSGGGGYCSGAEPGVRCTVVQVTLGTTDQAVPTSGVITRWSVRDAAGELALRVIDGPPGQRHVVASGPPVTVPGPGVQTFPVQIPVTAGQRIGVEVGENGYLPFTYRDEVTTGEHYDPPLGATPAAPVPGAAESRTYELLYNATIEPARTGTGWATRRRTPTTARRPPRRGGTSPSGRTGSPPTAPPTCATAGIVARTSTALIFRAGNRVFGCVGTHRTLLGQTSGGTRLRLFKVNGDQAAFVRVSGGRSSVVVVNLTRGRTTIVSPKTFSDSDPSRWTVTALVLEPSGDAAWMSRPAGEPDKVGVWVRHGARVQPIDSGRLRPTSLRLDGATGISYTGVDGKGRNSSFR